MIPRHPTARMRRSGDQDAIAGKISPRAHAGGFRLRKQADSDSSLGEKATVFVTSVIGGVSWMAMREESSGDAGAARPVSADAGWKCYTFHAQARVKPYLFDDARGLRGRHFNNLPNPLENVYDKKRRHSFPGSAIT